MKIIILILLVLLVGCNQKIEEAIDREQYCLDKNMTFDNTYVLQPNWTRCCNESTPTDYGTYRTNCKNYQFNQIESNETEKNASFFVFSNVTIEEPFLTITEPRFLNYSKTGYIRINPTDDKNFIYLECVNSTLVIRDNMLYCEVNPPSTVKQ